MSASSLSFVAGDTLLDAEPQFNAMAPYTDRETGQRANEIHHRVLKAWPGLTSVLSLWRFDLGWDCPVATLAAQEAAGANMLILSTYRVDELRSTVERWGETVLQQKKDCPRALVLLVDPDDEDSF